MREMGIFMLILAVAVVLVFLLWEEKRQAGLREVRVQKMRGGKMYAMLYPVIKHCRKLYIEQVRISQQEISISPAFQLEKPVVFRFEEQGFYPLTEEQAYALCMIVQEDLEMLKNKKRYRFGRQRITRPNGQKEYIYMYTINSDFKSAVHRAYSRA